MCDENDDELETNDFNIGGDVVPFFAGDTPSLTVDVTEPDGITPVNISQALIILTCKVNPDDSDANAVFTLSTDTGEIVISPQSGETVGEFVVTFPSDATANLSTLLPYLYSIRLILSGNVQTILFGAIKLKKAITQAVS